MVNLKDFDLYGYKPELLINDKKSFTISIGVVLTIFTIFGTLIAARFLGSDLFAKSSPRIVAVPQKEFEFPPFLIGKDNYQFSMLFHHADRIPVYDPQTINITFEKIEFYRINGVVTYKYTPLPSYSCNSTRDFPNSPENWSKAFTSKGICITNTKTTDLHGSIEIANTTYAWQYLRVQAWPCRKT